ncbi:hypothetical protein, partial [Burkholderia vietnamiensis]|uniref:hypothetical protein n=1 Tax=Burkholderia vietnamiensis TaxID=60552 RepID=UPI003451C279
MPFKPIAASELVGRADLRESTDIRVQRRVIARLVARVHKDRVERRRTIEDVVDAGVDRPMLEAGVGNVPQTVEGWDGGCGIDYATLRSWSMLDFEGERFRAAASTQS